MDYNLLKTKAQNFKTTIPSKTGEILILKKEVVRKKIVNRWKRGESVNGGIIGQYNSKDYEVFKYSINPLAHGVVDLTLTGALGNAITITKKSSNIFEIYSKDFKFDKISEKYGIENFNLNEAELKKLFEEIYNEMISLYMQNVWNV